MRVGELIAILEKQDQNKLVVLSQDSEGNGYSPLCDVTSAMYSTKDFEVGIETLTPELEKMGYSEADVIKGERAIVLYPIS